MASPLLDVGSPIALTAPLLLSPLLGPEVASHGQLAIFRAMEDDSLLFPPSDGKKIKEEDHRLGNLRGGRLIELFVNAGDKFGADEEAKPGVEYSVVDRARTATLAAAPVPANSTAVQAASTVGAEFSMGLAIGSGNSNPQAVIGLTSGEVKARLLALASESPLAAGLEKEQMTIDGNGSSVPGQLAACGTIECAPQGGAKTPREALQPFDVGNNHTLHSLLDVAAWAPELAWTEGSHVETASTDTKQPNGVADLMAFWPGSDHWHDQPSWYAWADRYVEII